MKKKLYSLFGVFFQNKKGIITAHDPIIGTRAFIEETMKRSTFYALLGEEDDRADISGMMNDVFGDSEITDFTIDDSTMSYRKRYIHRSDVIEYVFNTKEGNTWYGTWSGPSVGTGTAKCIVTEIDEQFFQPESRPEAVKE